MRTGICILFAASIFITAGCGSKEKNNNAQNSNFEFEQTYIPQSISDSIDWAGTYRGILPCADCEGIETMLAITEEMTFHIKTRYLGKDETVFEQKGNFLWNEEGDKIIINEKGGYKRSYLVGEDYLLQLDLEGNRITGELADKYYLKKEIRK